MLDRHPDEQDEQDDRVAWWLEFEQVASPQMLVAAWMFPPRLQRR